MAYVVSLAGFRPPPRFDGAPWEAVRVEEAAAAAGPWTQIDELAIVPLDPDPASPIARNVTTDNATLPDGWYRLVFVGPGGATVESEAVRYTGTSDALPPSPDDVRQLSELLRAKFPTDPIDADKERALRDAVRQSIEFVSAITCRQIDPTAAACSCVAGTCEPVPDGLRALAVRAVTLMTERLAVGDETKLARQRASGLRLRGFTAGPYSEQYWDPGQVRGGAGKRPPFIDDPDLDDVLYALATEDAIAFVIAQVTGHQPPAGEIGAFDYNWKPGIGRTGVLGGPGGPGAGPDGW
jgi:hypothetical protein